MSEHAGPSNSGPFAGVVHNIAWYTNRHWTEMLCKWVALARPSVGYRCLHTHLSALALCIDYYMAELLSTFGHVCWLVYTDSIAFVGRYVTVMILDTWFVFWTQEDERWARTWEEEAAKFTHSNRVTGTVSSSSSSQIFIRRSKTKVTKRRCLT